MIRFMIHTPVNVRGRMIDYTKDNLPDLEDKIGDNVALYTPHNREYALEGSEEWLAGAIEKGIVPDVIVTHVTEFATLDNQSESGLFSSMAGRYSKEVPIRNELNMLADPQGIFYPISVTPLVMIYNPETIKEDELEHSWADLFNEKYKVIFPDRDKPLCKAAGAFLMATFPNQFPAFDKRVVYEGSPVNMIRAVASGEYDIAMTTASFAAIGQSRGLAINSAKEGCVILPQVLVWKKGADEKLVALADLLLYEEMQEFLSEQGVWPIREGIPMSETIAYNQQLLNWQGWDVYLKAVSDFDKFSA